MCDRPASPGRMVRKSVPAAIWLALIPYMASNCGVATYTAPVKFCWPCARPPGTAYARGFQRHRGPRVQAGGEAVHRLARRAAWALVSCVICRARLRPAETTSWLLDRLGPIQSSGLAVRSLATRQITMARNTANVVAASAAPDRAR